MVERTQRGDDDRKREDEQMSGEPVEPADSTRGVSTTRDKGVKPVSDDNARHDDTDDHRPVRGR